MPNFFPCSSCYVISSALGTIGIFHLTLHVAVKWYLTVVFICISLMTDNIEYVFMCLFSINSYSWMKYFLNALPILKLDCFLIIELCKLFSILWIQVFYQISVLQIFYVAFHSLNSVLYRAEVFNFCKFQLTNFFFKSMCFRCDI